MPYGERNSAKTHCPKGHPYSGDNLVIVRRSDGKTQRECRECRRVHYRNWLKAHPGKKQMNERRFYEKRKAAPRQYAQYRTAMRTRTGQLRYDKRAFLHEVLGTACVDCGDDRSGAVQHHHVNGRSRDVPPTLTDLSWPRLEEEAMTLIALCGACHGVRHHKEIS